MSVGTISWEIIFFSDDEGTNIGLLSKLSDRVLKTAFYMSTGTNWAEIKFFFEGTAFFLSFLDVEQNFFWPAGRNFSAELSKLSSRCPWQHFLEKYYFFGRTMCLPFSNNEQIFLFFSKDSTALSKLHSTCPEEQSEENHIFLKKLYLFLFIFGRWGKNYQTSGKKKFVRVIKTAVYVSVGFFWWETLLFRKTLFPIFGRWTKHFRPSCKTFEPGRRNCILRVHKNNLRRKSFFIFLYGFRIRSEQFSAFYWNFSDRVVETAFYMSGGTFWMKTMFYWRNFVLSCFSDIEQKQVDVFSCS